MIDEIKDDKHSESGNDAKPVLAGESGNDAKPVLAGESEQLQKIARKIFYDFNIDTEYSGDFEAFYNEYFL